MRIAWVVGVVAVLGCNGGDGGSADDGIDDVWGEAPETPPDGARRIELPETVVPAYTDQQTCFFLDREPEDVFLSHLDGYQSEGGHHILLFRSVIPQEEGTIVDCSAPESMATLIPVISESATLPDGMAIRVAAGTQLVVQQHYVNTTDRELHVHDVLDVQFLPEADVATLAGFYANTDVTFELPPGQETTLSIRCVAPWDMSLLRVSPHMHEHGVRFHASLAHGAAWEDPVAGSDDPEPLVDVPTWHPEMRDIPPAVQWGREDALEIRAGDVFTTDCTFANDSGETLGFPKEMCAISGYYFPALEGQASWLCESGDDLDE